jgi:hypothetical protein
MIRVDITMYQKKSLNNVVPMAISVSFFILWKDARPGDALSRIVVVTKVTIMKPL